MPDEIKLCKRGHPRTPENVSTEGKCKTCTRERDRLRREANPDRCKLWRAKNKEKCRDNRREWRNANKGKVKTQKHRYYLAHIEIIKERQECYYETNREKICERQKLIDKCRRARISDSYVADLMGLPVAELHPGILEIKRMMIKLTRAKRAYLKGERHYGNENEQTC